VHAPDELTAFVRREHPRLVAAMTLLLDDRAVAEEIAQEALLRAASRWERVSELRSPGGWTHRVAVHLATSQLRRRRLERRARARLAETEAVEAVDSVTALTVRRALAALSPRDRRLLVLHHVLGWSAVELADHDGGTPEAMRQRLVRARAALRAELGHVGWSIELGASTTPTPTPATGAVADDHLRPGDGQRSLDRGQRSLDHDPTAMVSRPRTHAEEHSDVR
jgi:RNA polymerase sigma factor (sigma-70 family)